MNLADKCTEKEVQLLKDVGVNIENKDYSQEEIKKIERDIAEYIMNHSSKNGSIGRLQNEFQSIFRILDI